MFQVETIISIKQDLPLRTLKRLVMNRYVSGHTYRPSQLQSIQRRANLGTRICQKLFLCG